jgi:hypothetical protein
MERDDWGSASLAYRPMGGASHSGPGIINPGPPDTDVERFRGESLRDEKFRERTSHGASVHFGERGVHKEFYAVYGLRFQIKYASVVNSQSR